MPRYYFDSRDNEKISAMTKASSFPALNSARSRLRALTEIARDVIPGSERRVLAIEVRDENRSRCSERS